MRAANCSIQAFVALNSGEVVEGKAEVGSISSWKRATERGREVSLNVLEEIQEGFGRVRVLATGEGSASPSRGEDEADFLRMASQAGGDYSLGSKEERNANSPLDSQGRPKLARGAMADGPLEELSTPPEGFKAVPVVEISEEVRYFYDRGSELMLKKVEDVNWKEYHSIPSYWPPTYASKKSKLSFALRLYLYGMVGFCAEAIANVRMFTVVKKYTEARLRELRPVWDERARNLLWQTPPWPTMVSPSCFSQLDLSMILEGMRFGSVVGDLPNYFYGLENPNWMWPMFVIAGITTAELVAFALERGITISPGPEMQYVAVKILLMGWSWAPWVAQTALGSLLDHLFNSASGGARLVHRAPVPRLGSEDDSEHVEKELHRRQARGIKDVFTSQYKLIDFLYMTTAVYTSLSFAFIDDYGIFILVPMGEGQGDRPLKEVAARARELLTERGFPPHKEGLGEGLEKALGVTITARPYLLVVDVEKMRATRGATRHVLRMRRVTPSAMECLMGSWPWLIQAARLAYSVPHCVYALVHRHRGGPPPGKLEHCESGAVDITYDITLPGDEIGGRMVEEGLRGRLVVGRGGGGADGGHSWGDTPRSKVGFFVRVADSGHHKGLRSRGARSLGCAGGGSDLAP